MRWQSIVPILFLVAVLFVGYYAFKDSVPSLEVQVASKSKVGELFDRKLPWWPSIDSVTPGLKTSPDGVKMPIGWQGL